MTAGDYHDAIWDQVPPGSEPENFAPRLRFMLELVSPGEAVLDIGCGAGEFSRALTRAGARPIAVDVSTLALERARAAQPGLDVRPAAVGGALPLQDGEVHGVWAGEVIEHVHDVTGWLSEVRRVLSPGGWLALSTPWVGRLSLLLAALGPGGAGRLLDPRSDHLRFFTRRTLVDLLGDLGFESVRVRGVGGPPLLRHTLLAVARRGRW